MSRKKALIIVARMIRGGGSVPVVVGGVGCVVAGADVVVLSAAVAEGGAGVVGLDVDVRGKAAAEAVVVGGAYSGGFCSVSSSSSIEDSGM